MVRWKGPSAPCRVRVLKCIHRPYRLLKKKEYEHRIKRYPLCYVANTAMSPIPTEGMLPETIFEAEKKRECFHIRPVDAISLFVCSRVEWSYNRESDAPPEVHDCVCEKKKRRKKRGAIDTA